MPCIHGHYPNESDGCAICIAIRAESNAFLAPHSDHRAWNTAMNVLLYITFTSEGIPEYVSPQSTRPF